ncbi:zinc-binding metallopeptidase family protein [Mycoplasmopsis lipofaciens]|uniref:M42 family metallopeptidase n=1 Tax=Mycoplasmopsis lipofaciens TaxID=114884 RepID=UPI000480B3F3|nr:M42 family metallopeptidase [Mycoplasmopsis lipofaciens]
MTKQEFKNKLIQYMEIESMSRNEAKISEFLISNIDKNKFEISYDNFGSLILFKKSIKPNAPKIMIAAHMDEVGYLVKNIYDNGQILLSPVGGIWPTVVIGTKATLVTKNKKYFGVFGHTSIHIMEKDKIAKSITNKELYADFGFKNKEEAIEKGVEIGDKVYMSGETIHFDNPDLIGGKSMDNRAGVCVLNYIANSVANINLDVDLYLVGTVQEEVGTRGAKTSVSLINPDIAIALDTTSSHDTIGTIPGTTKLGDGAALRIMDGDMMADPRLTEFICQIGRKYNIKHYKFISMGGGTDGAELQYAQGGATTITISLPQRYLHSPIGVCDINDLIASGELLIKLIQNLNFDIYTEYIKYK